MPQNNKLSGAAAGMIRAALIILVAVIIYLLICSSTSVFYRNFMSKAKKIARIPGLSDGFIPQGICYCDALDAYLCCGYMASGPSRLYVIPADGGDVRELLLRRENGEDYTGHAGGVSSSGDHIWISNQKKAFHLTTAAIAEAEDGDYVAFDGYFGVSVNASFTFSDEEYFWIGEYHLGDKYKTRDENHRTAPDGSEHGAIIYGYKRDDAAVYGVDPESPSIALSVCDIVQGFCVTADGKYVLSTSGGMSNSHLYIYDCKDTTPTDSITFGGCAIPLYYLDSTTLCDSITLPRMSEDLDYHNGRVLIAFESGAGKYGGWIIPFATKHIMGCEID